jgi:hypothetical protein
MKIIFLILGLFPLFLFSQIVANNNSGTSTTSYTNGQPNNPVYIWCGSGNNGSLSVTPVGSGVYIFNWFQYSNTTFSWVTMTTQNGQSSTLNNLPNGGYRVEVTQNGQLISCDVAWVWNINNQSTATNNQTGCNSTNLVGTNNISPTTFTYYNPPPPQSLINSNTQITVCFTGTHTWVSDLGFYLIGPASCGSPVITLSPNPGSNGQSTVCNSGDNFTNLCFTTSSTATLNVCNPAPSTLSGTYGRYGPNPGTPINWSPLIGCNAAQGGWRVQVFDCVSLDVGALTNARITFSNLTSICGSPTTITYNSGTINSPINDNSCSQATASVYQVPPPTNLTTPLTLSGSITNTWSSTPPTTILTPSSLTTSVNNVINPTTFTLTTNFVVNNTIICSTQATTTFTPTPININITTTNPSCNNVCDGTATVTPTSGTPPFTYVWQPTGNTATLSNLCSGDYSVTVTDNTGCTATGNTTITSPPQITLGPINHN